MESNIDFNIFVEESELNIIKNIVHEISESSIQTLFEFIDIDDLADVHLLLLGYNTTNAINNLCGKIIKNFADTKYICFSITGISEDYNMICSFTILDKTKVFDTNEELTEEYLMTTYIEMTEYIKKTE